MLLSCVTGKHPCVPQYSFSTYFRKASWNWVVWEVSSSGLISIPMSHFLTDRNLRKESRLCAEMRSIPVVRVTSVQYLDSFCCPNFTAEYKSSFHCVIFLANACITPSMWFNISLERVMTWCRITVCQFDIHRVQYRNGRNTAMTYLTMVHSTCAVKSSR